MGHSEDQLHLEIPLIFGFKEGTSIWLSWIQVALGVFFQCLSIF